MTKKNWIEKVAEAQREKDTRHRRQIVLLSEREDEALRAKAEESGLPVSTLIREAIRELGVLD